jgi:hypothetical protein
MKRICIKNNRQKFQFCSCFSVQHISIVFPHRTRFRSVKPSRWWRIRIKRWNLWICWYCLKLASCYATT